MEWGDDGLIIEAAAENAFDFKKGSPLDIDYQLRLDLIKKHFQRKRLESIAFGLMVHNALICIQRTLTNSDDLQGDSVQRALTRFIDLTSGVRSSDADTTQLTADELIELYREKYKQEYGW